MNAEVFKKNPLLIMQTILKYAEANLDVDPEVKTVILENKELITQVKPEDLYEIFKEFMVTDHPAKYIREFKEVFFEFIPGLAKTFGFKQNNPWHLYDVFEHTMQVIENTRPILVLRIAALFHDLGKPIVYTEETKTKEDGTTYTIGHFFGHPRLSNEYFKEFAKQMQIPTEEARLIFKLILYHDFKLSTKPRKIQEYINDLGLDNIPLLFDIKRADNLAQNRELSDRSLVELVRVEQIFNEYISHLPKNVQTTSLSSRQP